MTQKWGQTPHFSTFLSSWFFCSISSDIFTFFSVSSFVSSRIFCFSCSLATTSFCRSLLIPKRRGKREWAVKLCHSKLKVFDPGRKKGQAVRFESQNNSKKQTVITSHWLFSISVLLSPWHLTLWDYTVEFICLWETHTRYWQSRFFCRKKSFSRVRNSTALFFSASNAFFSFSTSFTRFSWNREHVLLSNMK